jgi:hypothetical protein
MGDYGDLSEKIEGSEEGRRNHLVIWLVHWGFNGIELMYTGAYRPFEGPQNSPECDPSQRMRTFPMQGKDSKSPACGTERNSLKL